MTYSLPAGIAPWASHLAVLPTDVALALAPWVGRLALAVGPANASDARGDGEPDGYRGLARRGSYERLVTAEWGVADLFPEEFLRRATSGEHLFHELATTQTRGALRTAVVLSAGPNQLGTPRLAHLAVLVVLARRAAVAGATLAWGTLEDLSHQLADGFDEPGLHRFLAARTARAAGADALARWKAALGNLDDAWFVGDERDAARAVAAGWRAIAVRDVIEPNARVLDVEIMRATTRARVRLDLPTDELCARALRPPAVAKPARAGTEPGAVGRALDIRFGRGGRTLLIRLGDGGVESRPIPSSLREPPGHARRWRHPQPGLQLVAYGHGVRGIIAGIYQPTQNVLELCHGATRSVFAKLPWPKLSVHEAGTVSLVDLYPNQKPSLVFYVHGRLGIVKEIDVWPAERTQLEMRSMLAFEARGIAAASIHPRRVVWAERDSAAGIHLLEHAGGAQRHVGRFDAEIESPILFGCRDAHDTLVAMRASGWYVVSMRDGKSRHIGHRDATVIGPCAMKTLPALIIQPVPHQLAWVAPNDVGDVLPPSTTPIVSAAVSADTPYVAWLNTTGLVTIYNTERGYIVARFHYQGGGAG